MVACVRGSFLFGCGAFACLPFKTNGYIAHLSSLYVTGFSPLGGHGGVYLSLTCLASGGFDRGDFPFVRAPYARNFTAFDKIVC